MKVSTPSNASQSMSLEKWLCFVFIYSLCENSVLLGSFLRCGMETLCLGSFQLFHLFHLAGRTAREEAPEQGGQEPPGVGGQAARATQTTSGGGAGLCSYMMPSVSWEELLLFFQIFFPFHYDGLVLVKWILCAPISSCGVLGGKLRERERKVRYFRPCGFAWPSPSGLSGLSLSQG